MVGKYSVPTVFRWEDLFFLLNEKNKSITFYLNVFALIFSFKRKKIIYPLVFLLGHLHWVITNVNHPAVHDPSTNQKISQSQKRPLRQSP